MSIQHTTGLRRLGVAAAGTFTLTVAASGPAAATPPAPSASVADDTLGAVGTDGSDELALRLAADDPNTLQVDFGDDGSADWSFDRTTFSRIEVFLRSGRDRFRVDEANGAFADELLTVEAGAGDDAIVGGAGNSTLAGGDGDDVVVGGNGNETVLGGSGRDTVDGNRGADVAHLGDGRDTFVWDPGDGSDVVEGSSGFDTLVFNGANQNEVMSLAANGRDAVFLREQGTIRMDLIDVEALDLVALGGVDTFTVGDLRHTDVRLVDVDLSVAGVGDGQADVVTVNGSDLGDRVRVDRAGAGVDVAGLTTETAISGSETGDRLQIATGDGNDRVDVDDDVFGLIDVVVDLGPGQS